VKFAQSTAVKGALEGELLSLEGELLALEWVGCDTALHPITKISSTPYSAISEHWTRFRMVSSFAEAQANYHQTFYMERPMELILFSTTNY
jgi:hypothetical protein